MALGECPRCEMKVMKEPIGENSISNEDEKTWICSKCGINETRMAFMKAKGKPDSIPNSQFEMQNKFRRKLGLD